jgi:hypothetical protein
MYFETTLPLLAGLNCDVGDSVHHDALVTNPNSFVMSDYMMSERQPQSQLNRM